MTTATLLRQRLPGWTQLTIACAAIFAALLIGVVLATDVALGIAGLCAAVYLPLVLLDLPLAVALWVPLIFFEALPSFNLAGKAAGLLLIGGWVGALRSGSLATGVFGRHRVVFATLGLLMAWLAMTLAWGTDIDRARSELWRWWAVALVFVVVSTGIVNERALKLIVSAFVAGGLLTVLAVYVLGSDAAETMTGQLEGAAGNPNALAAGLVCATALAASLLAVAQGAVLRWLVVLVIVVLAVGVVASQSRGGMVAASASAVTAFVVLERRRKQVLALGLIVAGVATIAFALDPASWHRISQAPGGGTGRLDLWTVAWNMAEDHPVDGVGLANFGVVAGDYVRTVGPLERVDLIADRPHVVHNVYLQFLSETGIVGLTLFVVFALGCLYAGWRAAARFRSVGRLDLEALAHGIVIGTIGLLAAGVFTSNGLERSLWVMFGLGPAALQVATAERPGRR